METDGAIEHRELPFVVAILADLQSHRALPANGDGLAARAIIDIDRHNFDALRRASSHQREATWRGLHHLVFNTETGPMLRLRLLDVSKEELQQDLQQDRQQAAQGGQSVLLRKLGEDGVPCSLLLSDHEVTGGSNDMVFLQHIATVAAALQAPFIAGASPDLLGLDSFADPEQATDSDKLHRWCTFRATEDARWVNLILPHALLPAPDSWPAQGNNCRGNPAWLLAQRITQAFALHHWPAAIGGASHERLISPTDVEMSDEQASAWDALGLICLRRCQATGQYMFFAEPDEGQSGGKAMLPYLLAASRFAHYITAIARNKSGSTRTRADLERELGTWLSKYVLLDDNATQEVKAAYPLRAATVMLSEMPGEPGSWLATLFVKPQFQLEQRTTSIRLALRLPK